MIATDCCCYILFPMTDLFDMLNFCRRPLSKVTLPESRGVSCKLYEY